MLKETRPCARARQRHQWAIYGVSLLALACAAPGLAQAAEAPGSDGTQVDEIIVTALKGAVSVQDAPTTVNVVEGQAVENKGITSVDQLTSVVPGVRIGQAPGGLINPTVRGLSSSPSNNSFEQTVGLFVDGMFAGHPRDYSLALFDIQRIELLKGTQAAVVGKNTSVGAISLVTRKPEFEFGGSFSYLHEFELDSDVANVALNVPLSDRVAVRVAAVGSKEGGWIKNVLTGDEEPRIDRYAIRAGVRVQLTEALDWTASAQYAEMSMDGQTMHLGFDALGNARIAAARGGDTAFVIRRYESRWTPRPGFNYRGFTKPGSKTDGTRFVSTLNYDAGHGTFTSITGFSEYTDTFLIDGSALIQNPVNRGGHERDKTFSQELRYASDWSGPVNVIAGAYYYYDKWKYEDLFDFVAARLPAPPLGAAFRNDYTQLTKTASAFTQVTYNVTEKLRLTGGLRYEHFKKSGDYSPRTILVPGPLISVYGAYPAFKRSDAKDYVDYSIQGQYFLTPDLTAYVSFATGTKGFGYVANPTAPGGVLTDPLFRTEQSETFEAGVKATLAGRGHINLAVFNTDIKDYQIGVNLGTQFLIRNDQIRSRGAEINAAYEIVDGLRVAVAATYADVEKRGPLPVNSIESLPAAPKYSGIADVTYSRPVTDDLTFTGNLTAEFRTKQRLSDVASFLYPPSRGRVITDLRLALRSEKAGVEVAGIVRNLFDVYTVSYAFNSFGTAGAAQIAEDRPRTIALQVNYDF